MLDITTIMQNKTFWQYWKFIWHEASNKASQMFNMTIRIVAIVVSTFGSLLLSYLKNGNFGDTLIQFSVLIILWFMAWFFLSIFYFVCEPLLMHNKSERKIQELMDKWGLNEIPTTKVLFSTPREEGTKTAKLEITNSEPVDLKDCYVVITKVLMGKNGINAQYDGKNHSLSGKKFFFYPDKPQTDINRGSMQFLWIANEWRGKTSTDREIALLLEGSNVLITKDVTADVYIEISIYGKLIGYDGTIKPIKPLEKKYIIVNEDNCMYLEEAELPEQ